MGIIPGNLGSRNWRDPPDEKVKIPFELLANLLEELADTMDQGLILCGKFGVDPEELMVASEKKLKW